MSDKLQTGLYVVGTPIGNLGDMSARAIETLKSVDIIYAEDTRVSKKLLSHFEIKNKLATLHEHNESEIIEKIVGNIIGGQAVALITDSGMPAISDPGFKLVRAMRESGLAVFAVPGPTAFATAAAISGFPTDRITFCGFLPNKDTARDNMLREDRRISNTIIYYESPNRLGKTIKALSEIMPERRIAICREMTKMFEEVAIGYPADLTARNDWRGEIVIVIEPTPHKKISGDELAEIINDITDKDITTKARAALIAQRSGISKKEAYKKSLKR